MLSPSLVRFPRYTVACRAATGRAATRVAADFDGQNSCQSRFSSVHLVLEEFQERESKEMLAISYLVLSCPEAPRLRQRLRVPGLDL